MKHQLFVSFATVVIAIVAAVIVMIVHELCKAIAYSMYIKIYNKKYNKTEPCEGVFKIYRYIDPVGVIFAGTSNGIFSKQYPFVIRSKKASLLIGLTGYLSLIVLFAISILCYRTFFGQDIILNANQKYLHYIIVGIKYLFEFLAFFCATLFFVNFYPISTFDISLIIASISPSKYLGIRKFDLFFKLVFIIFSLIGIFTSGGIYIATKALGYPM